MITCIVGCGTFDLEYFQSIYQHDWRIIAADGGANHFFETQFIPEKIIGDLDSLEHRTAWEEKTTVLEVKEQDSTDIEKCLHATQSELYFLFGCTGDRFDHTLEVLHIFHRYQDKKIILFAGNDIIFRLPEKTNLSFPIGSRLSLYPLEPTQATSTGLTYPLQGITLEQGGIIGTSNKTSAQNISIQIYSGMLIGITSHDHIKTVCSLHHP